LIGRKLRVDRERSAPNARQGARVLFPRLLRRRRPPERWCCSLLDKLDSDAGTPTRTRVDRGPSGSLVVLMIASQRPMASLVPARCATREGCLPSPTTDSRVSARWGVAHRASRDAVKASHQKACFRCLMDSSRIASLTLL
jgi:hypothetical protein